MSFWKWRGFAKALFYLGVCVMCSSLLFFRRNHIACVVLGIGFLMVAVYVVLCRKYWRCPNCKKGLPLRDSMADSKGICPHCKKDWSQPNP